MSAPFAVEAREEYYVFEIYYIKFATAATRWKGEKFSTLEAVHKVRQHFFSIFDILLPHVNTFLGNTIFIPICHYIFLNLGSICP